MAGYNERFNFSMTIATNTVSGMNCTAAYRDAYEMRPGAMYNDRYYDDAVCTIYDEIIQILTDGGEPRLNCSHPAHTSVSRIEKFAKTASTSNYSCSWDAADHPTVDHASEP